MWRQFIIEHAIWVPGKCIGYWDSQGLQKVKRVRKSLSEFDSSLHTHIQIKLQPITLDGLLCSPTPKLPQFCRDLNLSSKIKICSVMTWFSYKEEINLTAGTRRSINLQSSLVLLSPPFRFYATGWGKKKSEWLCTSARVTLLRRKGAGKWGVGVRAERKIFHSLETEQPMRKQRAGAMLVLSMVWPGIRRGGWPGASSRRGDGGT